MHAIKNPLKAIKNSNLIESNRDNHPANGMITTSAIKYADITYETLSNQILRAPWRFLIEDPTTCILITFSTKPNSIIRNIPKFL